MPNGVVWGAGNQLRVFADSTGMHVKLPTGSSVIGGVRGKLTTQTTLDVATAHATLNRIDTVVAHLDRTSPYTITYKVVTGTASGSPVPPALVNTSTITEFLLGQVAVGAAVTTINAVDVTLLRPFTGRTDWLGWTPVISAEAGSAYTLTVTNIEHEEYSIIGDECRIAYTADWAFSGGPGTSGYSPLLTLPAIPRNGYGFLGVSAQGIPGRGLIYASDRTKLQVTPGDNTWVVDGNPRKVIIDGAYRIAAQ